VTDAIIGLVLEVLFCVALTSGVIYVTVTRPLNDVAAELRKVREGVYSLVELMSLGKSSRH